MSRLLLTSDQARALLRLTRELEELRRGAGDERAQHAVASLVRLVDADSAVTTMRSGQLRRVALGARRIATWASAAACGAPRLQSVQDGMGAGCGALESSIDGAAANQVAGLTLGRAASRPSFSGEDAAALHLFHIECGWALTPDPVQAATDDAKAPLTPRERATLECLLAGASEKEAAARLGLSVHTVHQYVKCLYRAYAVRSRAELMARCLRREGAVYAA